MARLPRLALPGFAHLVLVRGHNGEAVFRDEDDRTTFLDALDAAFKRDRVALHAYALLTDCVWLLCTPARDGDLSRAMQALGRRFAAAFNRRHDRSGSLWDGRYRSTVVEPGPMLLTALIFVDQALDDLTSVDAEDGPSTLWSSMRQHLGFAGRVQLVDLAEYWALGNTPFDRAAAFRALLAGNARPAAYEQIVSATQRGWPIGSSAFIDRLETLTTRTVRARQRGRPVKGQ
jgi:putative transposase